MPADYEIVSVAEGDKWDKDFGQGTQYFQSYDLVLTGPSAPNTPVSLNRKRSGAEGSVPADKVPLPDTTLYGSIEDGKFKTAQRPDESYQSASNGSSGAGQDEYARRPDHPDNAARARHSTALSNTTAYIEQMLTLSLVPQPKSEDEYWFLVGRVAGRLVKSYPGQAPPEEIVGGTLQPPADPEPSGPPVTPTPSDAEIPFRPI